MAVQIQMRRGTAANWSATNPTLAEGEIGLELDTQKFKMGTGTTAWNSLGYYTAGASTVSSVNGQTGVVVLGTDNVSEGTTNKYYTDARARGSLSAGTGISYNSTTGAISSTITQYTDALARAAVSATGSLSYNSTTGVFSYTQPTNVSTFTNDSGYITSSALSPYLTSATAASTYAPLTGTGASGTWGISITGNASNVTGTVAITNGGTGATTAAAARTNLGLGTAATMTGPSGTIVGTSDAQTLTNKRITSRVSSTASAASVTPDISSFDVYAFTALAAGLTINAPTGTPLDGDKLTFRIVDNGTPRTLTWNGTYTVIGTTLPTTTTANKTVYIGCIYNAASTRWDVIAVATQA